MTSTPQLRHQLVGCFFSDAREIMICRYGSKLSFALCRSPNSNTIMNNVMFIHTKLHFHTQHYQPFFVRRSALLRRESRQETRYKIILLVTLSIIRSLMEYSFAERGMNCFYIKVAVFSSAQKDELVACGGN